ncbi:transglycosylase domain-containing protein [Flavobacterium sp.]|uniref:transglycosylase domain-containing protein n=1 Tax=Flavobacterium sp. TaxID=239 RepID=UPI0025BBC3C6|nr:biosynthetic peptidoglycan transglycosylase [Flavobacterium sp.]MBA4153140.1 glycosyl transferase [Flavobacterium sp.]
MRTKKQKIILSLKLFLVFLVLIFITLYFFRDVLLQKAITRIQTKFETDFNCRFSVKKAAFSGLTEVELVDILLIPKNADTLLSVEKIKTNYSFFQLLTGNIRLNNMEMSNGYVQLIKNKNGRNFDAFLKKNPEEEKTTEKRNYAALANRLLTKVFNLIPAEMTLSNLSLKIDDMGRKVNLHLNKLTLEDHQLQSSIKVKTNSFSQNWQMKGYADPRLKKADLKFSTYDSTKIRMPYIEERFGLFSSFSAIHIVLNNLTMEEGKLYIDGVTEIEDLTVNHPKIASKDVVFEKTQIDYHFILGSNFIAIDSSSSAKLNKIKLRPFVKYSTEKDTIYTLKIGVPKMKAQDFVNSLPTGLFAHFEGMQVQGAFDYQLDFEFNKNNPEALVFESKLNKENLKILKYGEADLSKLNGEFVYNAIENGRKQRSVLVGAGNPYFTPLEEISPYLQKAVLTFEDPQFYNHSGFSTEAFKQSIAKNIKTKKFTRGASTISMQLVKNVFLTREKTLSRKLEEILLVYLLENNRLVPKARMLEVYLNVIEWGPNVYGIGESAQFYFEKTPRELTLNESLFLASIVPSPKKFMWLFDKEGNQKPYAVSKQKMYKNIMLSRGLIEAQDSISAAIPVKIKGISKTYLRLKTEKDSTTIDSIEIEEADF